MMMISKQFHICLICTSPKIIHLFQALLQNSNIHLTTFDSFVKAELDIGKQTFDAFIIDKSQLTVHIASPAKWIKEKIGRDCYYVLINQTFQEADVKFILNQILENSLSNNPLVQNLKKNYVKSLPAKFKNLRSILETLKRTSHIDHLKMFRTEIHKLAGSLGTYGFMPLSKLCKQLDEDLMEKIEQMEKVGFRKEWLTELEAFLNQIDLLLDELA